MNNYSIKMLRFGPLIFLFSWGLADILINEEEGGRTNQQAIMPADWFQLI